MISLSTRLAHRLGTQVRKHWLKFDRLLPLTPRYLVFGVFCVAYIFTAKFAWADTIVQGYRAKSALQPGMIVRLSPGDASAVQATNGNDYSHIYGVVIDPSLAPVTVQQQGQQVFVASGGNYPVLVSTQNGAIKTGDYISMSAISGIGAKAVSQTVILGRALQGFDGKTNVITNAASGQAIGRVQVAIVPGKNPLIKNDVTIPAPLKRVGQAIAGKNVTAVRIYAALAVFAISAIIAVSVLSVGIRSSIIAIGRNPLSKKSILRGLFQVVTVAVAVLIIGTFGVYLLLKA